MNNYLVYFGALLVPLHYQAVDEFAVAREIQDLLDKLIDKDLIQVGETVKVYSAMSIIPGFNKEGPETYETGDLLHTFPVVSKKRIIVP